MTDRHIDIFSSANPKWSTFPITIPPRVWGPPLYGYYPPLFYPGLDVGLYILSRNFALASTSADAADVARLGMGLGNWFGGGLFAGQFPLPSLRIPRIRRSRIRFLRRGRTTPDTVWVSLLRQRGCSELLPGSGRIPRIEFHRREQRERPRQLRPRAALVSSQFDQRLRGR